MPRWARFLSCSFTGSLLSLVGFFVAAYLYEGRVGYWQSLISFAGSPVFWYLAGLIGLLSVAALVVGRVLVHLYHLAGGFAGLAAGAAVALVYACFLVASHAGDWGGWAGIWPKLWPAGAVLASPFALSAGFTTWLWGRME